MLQITSRPTSHCCSVLTSRILNVWAPPTSISQTFSLPHNNYSLAPPIIRVNVFLPLAARLANDDDIENIFDDDDVNNRDYKLCLCCSDSFDRMQKIWLIMTFDRVVMKLKQSYCQTARATLDWNIYVYGEFIAEALASIKSNLNHEIAFLWH